MLQFDRWEVAQVTVEDIRGQPIFRATRGKNVAADIAIDNITVTLGACETTSMCPPPNKRKVIPESTYSQYTASYSNKTSNYFFF